MLYFVATPIGNLQDITARAIETLKSVDAIACEDTRRTLGLLNAFGVKKPLFSYHKFNENEVGEKIIARLKAGENIAVVSDAGMPVISDPGSVLVNKLIEKDLEFTVIPGACACVSALVLSGLPAARFCFLGFLPEKENARKEFLKKYEKLDLTLIFYSAPHDVVKDVKSIFAAYGDRRAVAVKEITKIHENVQRFDLKEGLTGEIKGEYVILVEGATTSAERTTLSEKEQIEKYVAEGMDKKDAVKRVAKERGVTKSSLYKYTIGL